MTIRALLSLGVLLAVPATSAFAATWTVDPARSTLGFSGTQTGEPFKGRFTRFQAVIAFDPARPEAARVSADVDMASAATGDPQKDGALPEADWFDAKSFAHATFEASGFVPKGGDAYETTGTLTLRGASRPVTLPFTLTIAGQDAHAVGQARILRTDFGVGQGQWSDGAMVGLDVAVDIDLVAKAK